MSDAVKSPIEMHSLTVVHVPKPNHSASCPISTSQPMIKLRGCGNSCGGILACLPRLNAAASASKRTGKRETKAACLPAHRERGRRNPRDQTLDITTHIHVAWHREANTLPGGYPGVPTRPETSAQTLLFRDPLLVSF